MNKKRIIISIVILAISLVLFVFVLPNNKELKEDIKFEEKIEILKKALENKARIDDLLKKESINMDV